MGKRYKDRPLTNHEIVEGYEKHGETAEDALMDARSFGYQYQYGRGFAHGAICAGIGCLIGGAVDLLMAKRDNGKSIRAASDRMIESRSRMLKREMDEAKAKLDAAREDNND